MTQLTFAFETVPAAPAPNAFANSPVAVEAVSIASQEPGNVVVRGRFPRRQRRRGLRQLGDVLTDVLDCYGESRD